MTVAVQQHCRKGIGFPSSRSASHAHPRTATTHAESKVMTGCGTRDRRSPVPDREIELFRRQVESRHEYDDPKQIIDAYRTCGLTVLPGAFNARVAAPILTALREGTPLSVIRIGDGEVSLFAHRAYAGTPGLDRHALAATLSAMEDSFQCSELWMTILRDLFLFAISQSDIVGVKGFGHAEDALAVVPRKDRVLRRLSHDLRGAVGGWRSIDLMIRFAEQGLLSGKLIASAHLYFAVLQNLDEIIAKSTSVVCVTSKANVVAALREKYPDRDFRHIAVGRGRRANRDRITSVPEFLLHVEEQLPDNLQGCLCLVGAGVWSEIYCTWIKRRGGVGVDIGSGFDLLDGRVTRPFHRGALGTSTNRFAIADSKARPGDAG